MTEHRWKCAELGALELKWKGNTVTVEKILDAFRINKGEKISDRTFMYNLVACVAGIVICLSSLTAVTWAWFGGSVSSAENTIKTASYQMSVSVYEGETKISPRPEAGYHFSLTANKQYTVRLEGVGSGSGYCRVTKNGSSEPVYFTSQVKAGEVASFTLEFSEDTVIDVLPCWGTYIGATDARDLMNGQSYVDFGKEGLSEENGGSESTEENTEGAEDQNASS